MALHNDDEEMEHEEIDQEMDDEESEHDEEQPEGKRKVI
jgi:hypothetical protein